MLSFHMCQFEEETMYVDVELQLNLLFLFITSVPIVI